MSKTRSKQSFISYKLLFLAHFFLVIARLNSACNSPYKRRTVFTNECFRRCLREVLFEVKLSHPFQLDAICLLPDHLHCIWTLPKGDNDFSVRWAKIKALVSRRLSGVVERPIFQKRFWEHAIRDQADLNRHFDYVHYNPKKHGYVCSVRDWPYSSFHRLVKAGKYELNWAEDGVSEKVLDLVVGE